MDQVSDETEDMSEFTQKVGYAFAIEEDETVRKLRTVYAHKDPIQFIPDENGDPDRMIVPGSDPEVLIYDNYGNSDMIYTGLALFENNESLSKIETGNQSMNPIFRFQRMNLIF